MSSSLKERYASTPLYGSSAPLVETWYEQYLENPQSVPAEWRAWFATISPTPGQETPRGPIQAAVAERARQGTVRTVSAEGASAEMLAKQAAVLRLISAYRLHGHRLADLDPLGLAEKVGVADLDPAYHGLGPHDMDLVFHTENLAGSELLSLKEIVELLGRVYSRSIGAEFTHLSSTRERNWLRQRFESRAAAFDMSADERRRIMRQLTQAEGLERYLHTRYVGQKRFSLEGGESLILLLDEVLQRAGSNGVSEAVIGMAHRGRINVLVNILGKAPLELFSEFEGVFTGERRGSGDVKYHMGFSSDVRTPGGTVHLALAFNPSHLEIVNPVVEGSVRARQERCGDTDGNEVIPILIHGDAAFAGQGVVMETLQMSRLRAFSTGGTFHVICNNQIGFTTSNPLDLRSTPNASDVAKFLEAPVLHVNADDPEAVIVATRVALDYRMTFNKDVVLDLVCYRRLGHNEADEPAATQPLMYEKIRKHPTARAQYAKHLIGEGVITEAEPDEMLEAYRADLEAGKPIPEANLGLIGNKFTADWSPYVDGDITADVPTRIDIDTVSAMAEGITRIPETVRIHNRVARIVADRKRMAAGEIAMDWGFAESMAYASVLNEGYSVRITGQDAGRGTFFHRHAVLHEQDTAALYVPLQHIKPDQPSFRVTDSFLSEEAVLGFEYGFATTEPDALVIWEAQFGDFANGAQVVIDQFISSGESKWGRLCGLTLLLPHGYEGQGPEHSSARLERFLQLCAENNMQVCVPSTPGQMFHMLRRQVVRNVRKPLIVMTPKSLLRHKLSVSPISALSEGRFHHVIDEVDEIDAGKVDRVVFCSGKVYFDLLQARRDKALDSVAIVRIEQLYPFPVDEYAGVLDKYANAKHVVWCQEEPENQGAWYQIRHRLQAPLEDKRELSYAGREGAAAPAAGYYQVHVQQQQALVESALGADASA